MPKLIKNNQVSSDTWQVISPETEALPSDDGNYLAPMQLFLDDKNNFKANTMGVYINSDEDFAALKHDLDSIQLIALNFGVFADGRPFSIARTLRDKYDYQGEIRAIGNFIRDQLTYLKRSGFDSFSMQEPVAEDILKSLTDFTEFYQAAHDESQPLFRRR